MRLTAAQKQFLKSRIDEMSVWERAGTRIGSVAQDGNERKTAAALRRKGVLDEIGHITEAGRFVLRHIPL